MEQQLARCRGGVHAFGQRTKGYPLVLQRIHDGEQVRQRAAKPIQLPDDKNVARARECQRLRQTRPIILGPGGVILEQMAGIDTRRQQRVALQGRMLPVGIRRNTHVANQHKRLTLKIQFPYSNQWC
jgi:hypothetical protein